MKRGKFERLIRTQTKEKVAGGVAVLAAGVVIAGAKHHRSRTQHYNELLTFSEKEDLNDRADLLFDFDDKDPTGLNLATQVVGKLRAVAPPQGVSGGLTAEGLTGLFMGQTDEKELFDTVEQLINAKFVEIAPLQSGIFGFCVTSELNEAILTGTSLALAQIYDM